MQVRSMSLPSPVSERQHPTAPDAGRDARVTTQVTTQIPGGRGDPPGLSSDDGRRSLETPFPTARALRIFFVIFQPFALALCFAGLRPSGMSQRC
jgi:hypothetical protein